MNHLIEYAKSFIGVPYVWGGESPQGGFDCSGLVQEILKSVGMDPPGDQSSQGLFNYFIKNAIPIGKSAPGAILFYGNEHRIYHVAFGIDHLRIIEAAGGDSRTVNIAMSIEHRAFVRMRPYNYRSDIVQILMPKYDVLKPEEYEI